MEELKILPCPFCGNKKTVTTSHVSGNGQSYVKVSCRQCTASVWAWGTDKSRAVNEWNRRCCE